jgi:hypothetical protein
VTMTLEQRFRNAANNSQSEFTRQMQEILLPGAIDAVNALLEVVRTSKNAQVRTAAARQILRVAYSVKVLDADPFKEMVDGLAEIGEVENDMQRED